jgi:plasmid stability protein
MHLRMPLSILDKLKDQAAKHRRSVAAELLTIVEEAMADTPTTAPQAIAQHVPMATSTARPPGSRVTNADQLIATIRQAIEHHGVDTNTERGIMRMAQSDVIRPLYYKARDAAGQAPTSHQSAYYSNLDKLKAQGAIFKSGTMIGII